MTVLQPQIKIGQKKLLPTPPAFHLVLWLIKGGCCWGRGTQAAQEAARSPATWCARPKGNRPKRTEAEGSQCSLIPGAGPSSGAWWSLLLDPSLTEWGSGAKYPSSHPSWMHRLLSGWAASSFCGTCGGCPSLQNTPGPRRQDTS